MTGTTLISADNTWALMAITCGWVAFSIYAEQTWAWASKLSGAIIALIGALLLTNLKIIPTNAPWFDDIIWGYVVPLAIPLLLLQCDIRKIWKESGKLLIIFLIGSVGTTCSAVLAFNLLENSVPDAAGVAAMMTGSYIGGGVNFAALSGAFAVEKEVMAATTVADNLLMACYFFVLIAIPSINFFRNAYKHPHMDEIERVGIDDAAKTQAAAYWERKPISLRDIAIDFATSAIIVWVSTEIAKVFGMVIPTGNKPLEMLNGLLSNKYLIMTTVAMLVATFGSKHVEKMAGSQEIGTYLIYLFLFVIGVPASIGQILQNAPMLFVFCLIMVVVNMLFCFIFGKLFKFDLEEIVLASNANIGGPTTAAAMAISKGWVKLVGPVMLVGTLGYVIGTYFGTFIGQMLGA
ncbi:DUF819 family protein [Anaerotignum sp. MB30-C6]|uniref:DUF819 family protein n=1 Tax=Anaerotignum sp. MB30-C6 TaxID=3070814 RepID=UPI0027DC51B2|nr:DUF819 family protein [Anaerotignum sp. MB30-C6]WMI80539.1 DUF819 family protein [Anaerotignum sp. MB30-C6]